MPYIKQEDRDKYSREWPDTIDSAGELNYLLTSLICTYMDDKVNNYACFNAVVGALESCKLEFYRRVVAHYEDKKILENGDVYEIR